MRRPARSGGVEEGGSRAFDGCPECRDAALGAIVAALEYVVGVAAPDLLAEGPGPVRFAVRASVRLLDPAGVVLAEDTLHLEQVVERGDETATDEAAADETAAEEAAGATDLEDSAEDAATSCDHVPRLADFQTMLDRLELARAPRRATLEGRVDGRLFAVERLVGPFEIAVRAAG
ncbi:MAG TPA: hypothetical protein VF763_12180 [Candidatus Limnocylindrales bacterium]